MNYENIKSTILTILVITSAVLTWTLWTYQPNFDVMEESDKTVEEVSLGEQKDLTEIVRPERLFYHLNGKHYGTYDSFEIERTINEMSRWNFSEFQDISDQVKDIPEFIYKKTSVDLIFPDNVPLNIYKSTLKLIEKKLPDESFNHIIIDLDTSKELGSIYFVSTTEEKVIRSRVPASFIESYQAEYVTKVASNEKFSEYELANSTQQLLLNKEPVKLAMYNHLVEELSSEKFRDALFTDPRFVQKNYSSFGEEYTDSTTLMSINYDSNSVFYVKTAQEAESESTIVNLLGNSIDFVNSHGGWTDNYRFTSMDESERVVLYRLYDLSGYPIFNDKGISEIYQIWGSSEINKYFRSNFSLGGRVNATDMTLPSGLAVLEQLKKLENFNMEFLQDVSIGYNMSIDEAGTLVHLEPAWFYKYKGQWSMIPSKASESRGQKHGLE